MSLCDRIVHRPQIDSTHSRFEEPDAEQGTGQVERSLSWLLGCRRLGVRHERRADLLVGLLHLACALICVRFLDPATG